MTKTVTILGRDLDFDSARKFVENVCERAVGESLKIEIANGQNPNRDLEKGRLKLIEYAKTYMTGRERHSAYAGDARRGYPWGGDTCDSCFGC